MTRAVTSQRRLRIALARISQSARAPVLADAHGVRVYGENGVVHIAADGRITATWTLTDARERRSRRPLE